VPVDRLHILNTTNIRMYVTVAGRPFRMGNILLDVQENMSSLLLLLLLLLWLILMLIPLLTLSFSAIITNLVCKFSLFTLVCKIWLSHSRFAVNSRPRRPTLLELLYLQHSVAMAFLNLVQDSVRHGVKFQNTWMLKNIVLILCNITLQVIRSKFRKRNYANSE